MDDQDNIEPPSLSRWITVPLGLLLAPFTILCVAGSLMLLLSPNIEPTLMSLSVGGTFLAGSVWFFYLSLLLIFGNPKRKVSFIGPLALRVIALIFTTIPLISFISGTFWEKPIVNTILTAAYLSVVVKILSMAKHRSKNT